MPAEQPLLGGRRPGRAAGLVLVTLLLGLAAWSVAALQPPVPAPADAPTREFSATRALGHVQRVAAEPHVAGSPANDRVVDSLVAALSALGLDPEVQDAVGTWGPAPGAVEMARVRNVVALLPGTDPTGRLFLVAHHDSIQVGPGAADDGAGVSAVLETVRALTEAPPLRNDVVVVLTDAEEACLCGAEAFTDAHPLAADGGVVLNLEARGSTGPPITFETSPGNAGLAGAFAAAAPHPVASSVAVEVYRALPNDTDFSVLLADGGFTGLNTAFIDGNAAYHTPQDTSGRLDPASLQAMGDNTLALARELGDRDLAALTEPAPGDATYFPVPGGLVRYPGALVWPVAAAAVAGVAALVWVARRRGESSFRRTAAGAGLALLPLVLAPLAAQVLWRLLVVVRPGYATMLDPWRPGWFRMAVVAVVVGVVLSWYALLRRRVGSTALAAGGLVWLAVLAAVLAAAAPGGSYLAAWPALAGAAAGIVCARTSARAVRFLAVLAAGAVAVLVLAPTVALFIPALGLATGAAPAFLTTLLVLALLPAAEPLFPDPGRRSRLAAAAVPAVALLTAGACVAVGLSVDRFDADHPVPSQLAYALDTDSGRAWWASTEDPPGAYTGRYVEGRAPLPLDLPYLSEADLATGPAELADLPASAVEVVADARISGRREVTVRVAPQRPAVRLVALEVTVDGGTVSSARVEGRAVPGAALGQERLWVTVHAPADDGVQATFSVDGDGPVDLRVVDGSDGLDGLPGFEPRPEGVDAAGSHSSDLVLVSATTELG